ncbi:MAG TPA: thioredoxin family protein [Anaerolineae bacterium]|nr:thioredoxin family protein [Anaerolineae bacterium]
MLTIKVLGSGCENCKKLEQVARNAVAALGVAAQFEKVTERVEIAKYAILATPGLVIDGKVVSAGRIPSEAEVTTWIVSALQSNGQPA